MTPSQPDNSRFVLQVVQPILLGLMDGAVSTLAPLFAAATLTGDARQTFVVGTAASVGAGVSMGLAEALSDDGALTGRGHPWLRGGITGAATVLGGMLHTLAFSDPRSFVGARSRLRCGVCRAGDDRVHPVPLHA